tara:strand:- start:259 stop:630 length:372 start_codon:yes stop_codon:yes gene_type:complete
MVSFADNIGFVFKQAQVKKIKKATIKKVVGVVASSKVVVPTVTANDKVIIMRHKEKSGNYSFIKETVLPSVLSLDTLKGAKIVSAIPKGRYEIKFVRKANIPAFTELVTKAGYTLKLVGEAVL